MISSEIKDALLARPFTSLEISAIAHIGEEKLGDYIRNYQGIPLNKAWVKRKGSDKFWFGLGKDGYHAFSRGNYHIFPTQAKDGNYYIGYFEFNCSNTFKYASGRRLHRTLLGNEKLSFDENGKETDEFCEFLADLMIEGAIEYGLV